ncbi:MAG: GNAT family N-acetyltransferase [Anaerolineales bacterium]|jgi:RimJ/RimL family protein N-acetyltransferase|nr:GNAT family N-acetyltransferase [Anaerolineales bacterium]
MKTPIYTERLTIRPLLIDDLDQVLTITGQPETYTYIPEEPMGEMEARTMIERGQNIPNVNDLPPDIAVTLTETKELVGLLSFNTVSNRFRAMEIGWMFHTAHRGKGYASEAARALMNCGFSTLGIHRIIAICDPRNIPSFRIMEKLGMRLEAEFVDSVILSDGEWHNEYFYAITEKEWANKFYQEEI